MFDLQSYRKNKKLTQKELGHIVGVNSQRVGHVELGRTPIPEAWMEKLSKHFDEEIEYQESDLKILKPSKQTSNTSIPAYEIDFIGGGGVVFDGGQQNPDYYIDLPEFSGCTAFRVYGDSMEPTIKSGSLVFAKKIDNWFETLEFGQIYGIVYGDGRRWCKKIRKAADPSELLLQSENPEHDPFEVKKINVKSIWLIHGWLVKKV